jgi:hypothetical protein
VFDDLEWLRENEDLRRLLNHYAESGAADRDAWQDRLMALEGVEARDLVRLHGLLIGFGWLEQNTGSTAVIRPGAVRGCYRITAAGLCAGKAASGEAAQVEADAAATEEAAVPRRREGRKARPARARKAEASGPATPVLVEGEVVASMA